MASDQPAVTARTRLPVIVMLVLCTALSVVFYLRVPFGQIQEIPLGNVKPKQRHITHATNRHLVEEQLRNITQHVEPLRPSSIGAADQETVTLDFTTTKKKEQVQRKATLREACKQKISSGVDVRNNPPARIYVDEEYKVLYCSVPKIACTSWKKVFLVLMKAFKTTEEISQYYTNRAGKKQLKELRDFSPFQIDRILKTYTKFMFARHPFSRVLSAFKNKLAPDSSFERAVLWQRSVGKRIIDRYRDKDHLPQTADNYDLTFNEFIKYLIDPEANGNNLHWSEIYKQCLPCDIDYDIIGKFETLQSDSKFILNLINAEGVVFPGSDSSSPTGSSNQTYLELHFKDVPLVDLQKLYERFRLDFQLFGYDPPTLAFKGS
ncbi:carbohydrate sulfotransferase 13-like isoform X1 [Asterias rubens]|uniref:carbohydrate sulfotransferase 13-like isoform X1 n=1 Tax=Asterias rubens TaxID=7604 RepID=UPI001455629A|nr:carbohydrate sulfotransferase 13-like isoform X1 [Asterias rubens]XP_033624376.1 carbohydrate sulfotransferase 13-like isoform X1 [Asterias rubens]